MTIEYKIGAASQNEIHIHLLGCARYIISKLSDKVDIYEYSEKIFNAVINF